MRSSWVLLVPWLLFFPNAPYLLTDFIHLGEGPAPLWYDALMLSAFAWTALLLGFGSLYLVQMIIRRAFGADGRVAQCRHRARRSRASASTSAASSASTAGMRSCTRSGVADVIQEQLSTPAARMAEALIALTGFLLVGYLVVYSFTDLRARARPSGAKPAR